MEKRLIIAIALSIFIILAFQTLAPKPPSPPTATVVTNEAAPLQAPAGGASLSTASPSAISAQEIEYEVEAGKYIITFSNIGGAIKGIRLKEYKDSGTGEPLHVVNIQNPREYIFSMSGIGAEGLDTSAYALDKSDGAIIYSLKTKGLEITKKYILHNSKYGIALQLSIKNTAASQNDIYYKLIGGAGMSEKSAQDKRFLEVTANINGKAVGFKRPKDKRITNPGIATWAALKNKYFSVILKPLTATRSQFYSEDTGGNLVMGLDIDNAGIQPNAVVVNKFVLYVGPSHIPVLKEFGYDLEETVNYGFFGGISKIMIVVMQFFYSLVRSWGFAIILLSVFLNMLTFPLTMKSMKSMQKMQELHPQMEKLKKLHKDNPQKLNKEIMELYKTYGINPFSGCLPIILQMPIFIALYAALMRSIELRNASFLWIRDLSSPDAVSLPMTLPMIGNSINILPLFMVVAMVIQQKMSTKSMGGAVTPEQKEQQKIMLIVMPVVFGFVFYSMPSGLVLYWLVNTVLTIVEQKFMLKKTEA